MDLDLPLAELGRPGDEDGLHASVEADLRAERQDVGPRVRGADGREAEDANA
jgi:hypothetical protein